MQENKTQDQSDVETASTRQKGGESLVNRVFREVALSVMAKAGVLSEAREQFVGIMSTHPAARKTDKAYAQRYADDMGTRLLATVSSQPVAVSKVVVKQAGLSQKDIDELFGSVTETVGSLDDLIDLAKPLPKTPLESLMADGGPMSRVLTEFLNTRKEHPFVRVVTHEGQRYVGLGTIMGVLSDGKHGGQRINVHMTVTPHKRFHDVPEDIAPMLRGRQLSLVDDVPGSPPGTLRKFLFVVRHRPGLKIRWWLRLGDKDQPNGVRRIVLTDDAAGFRTDTDSPTA